MLIWAYVKHARFHGKCVTTSPYWGCGPNDGRPMASNTKRRGGEESERRAHRSRDEISLASVRCCAVVQQHLIQAAPPESLRAPVAEFVTMCRSSNAPPERMLTVFKRGLARVPALAAITHAEQRTTIVEELVLLAIEEYYAREV